MWQNFLFNIPVFWNRSLDTLRRLRINVSHCRDESKVCPVFTRGKHHENHTSWHEVSNLVRSRRVRNDSELVRFRSVEEAHCARREHDFPSGSVRPASSHEVHCFPLLLPTGRSLGRQVKPKTFTPALPHLLLKLVHRVAAPVIACVIAFSVYGIMIW